MVLRGAAWVMSAAESTVVALVVSSLVRGVWLPVTTMASSFNGSDASVKFWVTGPPATLTVSVWARKPIKRTST